MSRSNANFAPSFHALRRGLLIGALAAAGAAPLLAAADAGRPARAGALTLAAGSPGGSGIADGPCASARFTYPLGIAVDAGNNVYIADYYADTIRKIAADCTVSTLAGTAGVAGSADGAGMAASFDGPTGLAIDAAGDLYVTDTHNNLIRKVTPAGVVSTVAGRAGVSGAADGAGLQATFNFPQGIAIDNAGRLYVADTYNDTVRRIGTDGMVQTLAGVVGVTGAVDGTGAQAEFNEPTGIVVTQAGNILLADSHNYTLRQITPAGVVTTFAGKPGVPGTADGTGSQAQFGYPTGLSIDAAGTIYIVDSGNNAVRKSTPSAAVSTFFGKAAAAGGTAASGSAPALNYPTGIAVGASGGVYVADSRNFAVRLLDQNGVMETLAGDSSSGGSVDGPASTARLQSPSGVAADDAGNEFVADTENDTVRWIRPDGRVSTLAGRAGVPGYADGWGADARFNGPMGVAVEAFGEVYVADTFNHVIRAVSRDGHVRTVAGRGGVAGVQDGVGGRARFDHPIGLALGSSGELFVTDAYNNTIRRLSRDGTVTTVAGVPGASGSGDGPAAHATFSYPMGIVQGPDRALYVADAFNNTVRKISPSGIVTTLAGTAGTYGYRDAKGADARFVYPSAITADRRGNLYVCDADNQLVRELSPQGDVTTYLGRPNKAGNVLGALPGGLSYPAGIAASEGHLFIATGNAIVAAPVPASR